MAFFGEYQWALQHTISDPGQERIASEMPSKEEKPVKNPP